MTIVSSKMHFANAQHPQKLQSNIFRPERHYVVPRYRKERPDTGLIDKEVKKNVRKTCQENFNQYLLNTTLHGLRYVGDKKITPFERYE